MNMERISYNKTKIVATVGPASNSKEMLRALAKKVSMFFVSIFPMVHTPIIRRSSILSGNQCGVGYAHCTTQDLQGPKIRVNEVKEGTILEPRSVLTITTRELVGNHEIVSTSYENLPNDVKVNDMVLIDDGKIELKVIEVRDIDVVCEVVYGGPLKSRKGINLPYSRVTAPS